MTKKCEGCERGLPKHEWTGWHVNERGAFPCTNHKPDTERGTPRTDAEAVRFARLLIDWSSPTDRQVTELVPSDFARQLEAEITRLKELNARYEYLFKHFQMWQWRWHDREEIEFHMPDEIKP